MPIIGPGPYYPFTGGNPGASPSGTQYDDQRLYGNPAGPPRGQETLFQARTVYQIPPPTRTLTETFDTYDSTIWTGLNTGLVDYVSGRLQIACTTSYNSLYTLATYRLTGDAVSAEVPQVPPLGAGTTSAIMRLVSLDWSQEYGLLEQGGVLFARLNTGSGNNDVSGGTYDPVAMRWWRISESEGTVSWAYSADSQSWTTFRTATPSMSMDVRVLLQSGYYGAETSPGPALFDNINVPANNWAATINDPAGVTDGSALAVALQVADSAGAVDAVAPAVGLAVTDSAGLVGGQTLAVGVQATDATGLADAASLGMTRRVDDLAGGVDGQALTVARQVVDLAGLTDGQALGVGRSVADPAGLVDSVALSSVAKAATLTDDFATADGVKWGGYGANVAVVSGQLKITTTSSYPNLFSAVPYDLTASTLAVEVPQVPNVGNGTTSAALNAYVDSNNSVAILWEGGVLKARAIIAGVTDSVNITYNPVAHKIWRLRESGGTLYFEASATGASWFPIRSPISSPSFLSSVTVTLQSGYSGTETSPGFALFDNVNATYPSAPGSPRTFYVDPAGSDSNNGLASGAAWATLSKVSTTALYPGDQVLFKRGGTWTGNLTAADSGATGNTLTYGAYGTGAQPVISGGGSSGVAGSAEPAQVYNSFVVVDGIEFRGALFNNVYVAGPDCVVQNCTTRWGVYGVYQEATAARLKVLNNTIADINVGVIGPGTDDDYGASGVGLYGDSAEIAYNTISGCIYTSPDYGLDGQGIEVYGATNAVVHHNRISECVAAVEMGNPATNNCTVHNNVLTCSTITVGCGILVHGSLYSVGVADPFGPVLATKIYHNTILMLGGDSGSNGLWVGLEGEVDCRNNIVVATASAHTVNIEATSRTVTESGNVFWNVSVGAAGSYNFQGSGSPNASSTIADPLFVSSSDVRLLQGSPAVNRGTDLGYTTDYAGNPRNTGAAPDSGAYEGVLIPVTVTDSTGLTGTQALGFGLGVTDSVGLGDGQSLTVGRTQTDTTGAADAAATSVSWARQVDDPTGTADTQALALGRAITDPAGLADSQAAAVGRQVDDPTGLVDSTAVAAAWVRAVTDDAGVTDVATAAKSGSAALTLDDPVGLTGAQVLDVGRAVTDPAGLADAPAGAVGRQVDDSAAPTDTATAVKGTGYSVAVDDSAGLTGAQAVDVARAVADPAGVADSTPTDVGRSVTDPAGTTDGAALDAGRALTDSAGLTGAQVLAVGRQVDDPAGLVDVAALIGSWTRVLDDPAGLVDQAVPAKSGSATITINDLSGLTDPAGPAVGRGVDDPTGLVDTAAAVSVHVQSLTDPAGPTDVAATVAAYLRFITDVAGATDTVSALGRYERPGRLTTAERSTAQLTTVGRPQGALVPSS